MKLELVDDGTWTYAVDTNWPSARVDMAVEVLAYSAPSFDISAVDRLRVSVGPYRVEGPVVSKTVDTTPGDRVVFRMVMRVVRVTSVEPLQAGTRWYSMPVHLDTESTSSEKPTRNLLGNKRRTLVL